METRQSPEWDVGARARVLLDHPASVSIAHKTAARDSERVIRWRRLTRGDEGGQGGSGSSGQARTSDSAHRLLRSARRDAGWISGWLDCSGNSRAHFRSKVCSSGGVHLESVNTPGGAPEWRGFGTV